MTEDEPEVDLNQIETRWSLIFQAHLAQGDAGASARSELMDRYAGAVLRYLLWVARDPEVAADLAQDFALRFLRGDFHRADPSRGRFRDYVKGALRNLLIDHRRREKIEPRSLSGEGDGLSDPSQDESARDRRFLDCWRDEILGRAWERLSRHEEETRRPYFSVLRFRADHPDLRSYQIAERLGALLGKGVSAGWVRLNLMRAREVFAGFLKSEVSLSLGHPSAEEVDDELRLLGLWSYCRPGDK